MEDSIWSSTLASFRDTLAAPEPLPASVSAAAVVAALALALLIKVVTIAGARKNFTGDRREAANLIESARREMASLTRAADEDVAAFQAYMDARRAPEREKEAAARRAVEVPLAALGSVVRGLELCPAAAPLAHAAVAADLAGAAAMLGGAARAMAASIESNLRQPGAAADYTAGVAEDLRSLAGRAARAAESAAMGVC